MSMKPNNYYITSDLSLAAALSLFYSIEVIDKTSPGRAQFLFRRDESLDKVIETFWRRELKVDPLAYFNQLKIIKSRLYEER